MKWRLSWQKNWPDVRATLRRGFPSFVFQRDPKGLPDGIPVFCYHAVDPTGLEADFTFLQTNGYTPYTAKQLLDCLSGDTPPDERAVVLTVDDGAQDLYAVLYPALKRYAFHAVAFVAPAFHLDAYDPRLKDRPCTWAELREMDASGCVDVQAHTWSHRYVPRWPEPLDLVGIDRTYSRAIQEREPPGSVHDDLARAKSVLETRLNKTIQHLAFPMYTGTKEAIRYGETLGYRSFWWGTLPNRPANPPGTSPTHLVRLGAEWIRRLPGAGRIPLRTLVARRLQGAHKRFDE